MTTLLLGLLMCGQVAAAEPASLVEDPEPIYSMGHSKSWKPQLGTMLWWQPGSQSSVGGELQASLYKDLIHPVIGLGVMGEGYFRAAKDLKPDGGLRILGAVKYIGFHFGYEYSFREDRFSSLLGFSLPLRRGGPFGRGGSLRFDWLRRESDAYNIGFTFPLGQPHMGKTRPRTTSVRLPRANWRPLPPQEGARGDALNRVREAASWIDRFSLPYLDQRSPEAFGRAIGQLEQHIQLTSADHPLGQTFQATLDSYHLELLRAFALALDDQQGERTRRVAKQARETLLDEVILPYNRLLGQRKKRDSLMGFGTRALEAFGDWAEDSPDVEGHREAVMDVFQGLVEMVEQSRARSRKTWGDSRLVWIPLHYAVASSELDTQQELSRLLERASEEQFSDANDVHYVVNEMFQVELARQIKAAEDYHVLWVHDYKGKNYAGEPDRVAFHQTVEVYLKTLTERVRQLDETGRLPVYIIYVDQFFYELFDGPRWTRLLEDPLRHRVSLGSKYRDMEAAIREAQDDLREAVAASRTLQEGERRHGPEWLRNRVKVQINVNNPADPSFTSAHLFRFFPVMPDNMMRDHRKIAFYDVTEQDPGRGEAIFGGMGVGEHYAGPTWADRAILVRGPALVRLKDVAREVFLSQGFEPEQVPPPLRPLPLAADYEQRVAALRDQGWDASVMEVHNATGFGTKQANLARAVLYNAMPAGTHIYVPDSLWNSPFWSGLLMGAALRGCRVAVIAPSEDNIPVSGGMMNSRANEVMARLVLARERLEDEITEAGGFMAVGVYDSDVGVGDVEGKLRAMRDGVLASERFREIFPFDPSVYDLLSRAPSVLEELGYEPRYLVDDASKRKPKLHLKTQFFASGKALETLLPLPEWEPVIRGYLKARVEQTTRRAEGRDVLDLRAALSADALRLERAWYEQLTPREQEQVFFFLSVGSHNEDYRGMILDGEVSVIVARQHAMLAFLDFFGIISVTDWVEDVEELETMLPRHGWFTREFARFVKYAL